MRVVCSSDEVREGDRVDCDEVREGIELIVMRIEIVMK
jgi:hypothetical protein